MRVHLSAAAEDDLANIYTYYRQRSDTAADRILAVVLKATRGLGRFPKIGKPGHYPGTRELFTTRYSYRIVYEVNEADQVIDVLRILHGAQQWPPAD